jgi:hypothetical protein
MSMNKVKNKNYAHAMRWGKMHPRTCIQDISYNNTTICPISFTQKFILVLYIGG